MGTRNTKPVRKRWYLMGATFIMLGTAFPIAGLWAQSIETGPRIDSLIITFTASAVMWISGLSMLNSVRVIRKMDKSMGVN